MPKRSPFEEQLIAGKLSDEQKEMISHFWGEGEVGKLIPSSGVQAIMYNEPAHYHQHEIDTIEFLQRGFPPQVFMGFAIGHIVKYAQRADYKNGREDFVKMVDYARRALDWYDKTHKKN